MSSNAFAPQGNTIALNVTATTHSAVQVDLPTQGPLNINYVITNLGPNTAYISWAPPSPGNAAPSPALTAVIPVDGTPANGYPILSGSKETITAPPNAFVSAICAATQTATLLITPGEGV